MTKSVAGIIEKLIHHPKTLNNPDEPYEYCPRCDANLTLQKGYSNDLPYWICKGCGEMLINPEVETDTNISWICDGCGTMLNIQPGFTEEPGDWVCTECGYVNKIDPSELYESEDEYQMARKDPYKGLSDEAALELSRYQEEEPVNDRPDIILVRDRESGETFVKKLLTVYDRSVYEYLKEHPVSHMPRIIEFYEGDNCLIVIEEYIEGKTISQILEERLFPEKEAVSTIQQICSILTVLHNQPKPIIHRDIKPSNIIVNDDGEVFLLDVNVAKWYDPDETDDTRYLGTQFFAAPEQVGYGMSASNAKTDIYAVGMLLNLMITGKFPKEQIPDGAVGEVIRHCICLESDDRYSDQKLMEALHKI